MQPSLVNTVELLGHYGGDETHALSAWTSTGRELTDEKRARIPKLLNFLADNKHHTPFEKSSLHFLVKVDTATHIHLLKHRIGVSINGESARYKEHIQDKYYVPEDWSAELQDSYMEYVESAFVHYHKTVELLTPGHGRKRAKESARFFLPYGSQVYLDILFNFRSFMHFVGLRHKEDAQKEVRDLSDLMLHLVQKTGDFNESLSAFGYDPLWT